jgi:hypothetical protein
MDAVGFKVHAVGAALGARRVDDGSTLRSGGFRIDAA